MRTSTARSRPARVWSWSRGYRAGANGSPGLVSNSRGGALRGEGDRQQAQERPLLRRGLLRRSTKGTRRATLPLQLTRERGAWPRGRSHDVACRATPDPAPHTLNSNPRTLATKPAAPKSVPIRPTIGENSLVAPPFHSRWETLTLDEVREFLQGAAFEAITWEAKGGTAPRKESVRKAVCGFANARGGTLILGAGRAGDPPAWRLEGMTFRDEPPVWLSAVVAEGVTPAPPIDVRSWATDGGRHVAAVAVEPVAAPPCMTSDGAIFERVSGRTVPVVDPIVLAGLFARGEAARTRAAENARESASRLFKAPPIGSHQQVVFTFALAPVGLPAAFKQRMFRETFAWKLADALGALGAPHTAPPSFDATREHFESRVSGFHSGWALRVAATGVAIVVYAREDNEPGTPPASTVIPRLEQGWELAAEVLASLGAYPPAMATLCFEARSQQPEGFTITPRPATLVQHWTELRPTESDLAAMRREIDREAGYPAWEPEPPASTDL